MKNMKHTILITTIISSLLYFSGNNILQQTFQYERHNAKNLKNYFPKKFSTEEKPRIIQPRDLTKKEHQQVSNYVNSFVEIIEVS